MLCHSVLIDEMEEKKICAFQNVKEYWEIIPTKQTRMPKHAWLFKGDITQYDKKGKYLF